MQSVVGIDVSKDSSVGQAFLNKSKSFGRAFVFRHTKQGFQELLNCLLEVEAESKQRPWVILEATGHYHNSLVLFLQEKDYITVVVNPLVSQRMRKTSLRKVKTDAADASHLAELFYKEEFEPYRKRSEQMHSLRLLSRHQEGMSAICVQLKLKLRSLLDQTFPLYEEVFGNLFSVTSLEMLKRFPTPLSVLEESEEQIASIILSLNTRSKSLGWAREKAKKMMAAAQNSPRTTVYSSHLFAMREMINMVLEHQEHLKRIEDEMNALAEGIKEYDLLRSIPGIGDRIAATILAEIGDINQFEHAKKLVAFAGIDPSVY